MLTWTEMQRKAQRLSRDTTAGTLVQLQEDMNTGYSMFNAKFARYYSRKQQFTDVVAGQGIYQTPIDCIKIIGMTVSVSNTYQVPIKEVRSEFEWRQITAYPYSSNWPAYYYMIGNDEVALWPTPSQTVANGLRYYYQQTDHDLSVEDIVSTAIGQTCTVTNGSPTVTSTGSTFTSQLIGLQFQLTGITDLTWYEIANVPDASTLTLKSAVVVPSASGLNFRIGQCSILPGQYQDTPIHYALGLFFASKGNNQRSAFHLGIDEDGKRGLFWSAVKDAIELYSSSTEGNVITDDGSYLNAWMLTPLPPTQ
jgi:hypothetical protein